MKSISFDRGQQRWDQYEKFYYQNGPFTLFEDGSMIVNQHPDPDYRKYYDFCGIQLVATTDDDLPELFTDPDCTDRVTKAWLTQNGLQHLAVDFERGKAYRLSNYRYGRDRAAALPDNVVSRAYLYYAGGGREPFMGTPIAVSMPDRKMTNAIRKHMEDTITALTASWRISNPGGYSPRFADPSPLTADPEWLNMSTEHLIARLSLNDVTVYRAVIGGIAPYREVVELPHLFVKKENADG